MSSYVGPYSPAAYQAANQLTNGGSGTPATMSIIQAGQAINAKQAGALGDTADQGSVLGASTTSAAGNAVNAANINNVYDTSSNFYKGLLDTIDPQKQQAYSNTDQYYGDQLNGLQGQRDSAFANLDQQSKVANQSYSRSLQQLGNSIRNTYQGQTNALGTQGAGDSSAADQLGYALGQQNNTQRGYMNQDLNNQMTSIGLTRDSDQKQFDNQASQINDLKQQQYTAIANQYAQLQQQINTQLANNEQARKQALMYAGQWAQGQAASVDTTLQSALGNIQNAYSPANQPKVAPVNFGTYQAHNVVPETTQVGADLSRPVDNYSAPLQIFNPYRQDQQPQY
jgi:hypothetical protein